MKGVLAFHGRHVPHEHDLERILLRCEEIEPLPEISDLDLRTITDYMLMARYSADFWPEWDTAAAAVSAAETTRQQMRSLIPPEAHPE